MAQEVAITKNTAELERLEGIIRRNLQSFYEVGRALMEIRDSGLYRDVLAFDTFEAYCKAKWDMKRTYAFYMIESAKVMENVHNCEQKPATESQTRPLARLEPDQQREAWQRAVETAPEGKEKIIDFLRTFVLYSNSGRRDLPGCSAWDVRAHSPGKRSASFFMRGAQGRVPSPAWDASRGQVPGDHPGEYRVHPNGRPGLYA